MEQKNLPLSLIATVCAILLIAIAIFFGQNYANNLEQKYIHAIAPLYPDSVINGSALQKVALQQTDLLPVYGASEEHKEAGPFQASQFFQNYPTGFTPFDACKGGADSLTELEALASVGKSLQGKKVIISFTPKGFFDKPMSQKMYKGFFTGLHANELIFSPYLSYSTKQLSARRMLHYPETLGDDPLLSFAIDQLARNTWLSKMLYWIAYPLGRMQADIMESQDSYQSVSYIFHNQKMLDNNQPHVVPATIDWQANLVQGLSQAQQQDSNNPFGFSKSGWKLVKRRRTKPYMFKPRPYGSADAKFIKDLKTSPESADFSLELQILKELGAKPLLVGRPINDKYYNAIGISNAALNEYYAEIESIAAKYNMPIVDFKNFQNDIYFGVDPAPHTSQEGWVYVDQVYNNFYHENIH